LSQSAEGREAKKITKGKWIDGGVMYVAGEEFIARVAAALASVTRLRILGLIFNQEMGIEELAEKLGQSKANISTHVKRLETEDLVKAVYVPGQRGVKKIAKPNVREIRIILDSLAEGVEERIKESPVAEEFEEE